jgi:micrococcal nuclease
VFKNRYLYSARVLDVIDGDTLKVELDLGLSVYKVEKLRLFGVNTPETYGVSKDSEEYKKGVEATNFVVDALQEADENILVETIKDREGKYGRLLALVYFEKGCLNQILVEEGLAIDIGINEKLKEDGIIE